MDTKERASERDARSRRPSSRVRLSLDALEPRVLLSVGSTLEGAFDYAIVDTGQTECYDDAHTIAAPSLGEVFYGQDAQHDGNQASYTASADGLTVNDNVTRLTWTQGADWSGDGTVGASDKFSYADAQTYVDTLNDQAYGGFTDWRVPTIKELYSLIDYRGTDPDPMAADSSDLVPFIDDDVFEFAYGDTSTGERIIDSQWVTSTLYVSSVMGGETAMFGVNFADGRIKGYPAEGGPGGVDKTYYARFVRGNADYGTNSFTDNGDGTITDSATGLTWSQSDNGAGVNWEDALAWVQEMNDSNYLGHSDWRLPNAKELQSLVDYTRSPDTHGTAAIDPAFDATQITNEAGESDYAFYWSGTTFLSYNGSADRAVYVAFGEGMGTMDGTNAIDVHGAGCQRSDPKDGDPDDYPSLGNGPQGDAQRVFNYVRLVRDADDNGSGNSAPTAEAAGPYSGQVGDTITLSGAASSDADGTITLYEWDLDNDGEYDDATGVTTEFSAANAGSYTIGLRVTDDAGAIDTDLATVDIAGEELPVVTIAATDADAAEENADTGTFTITRAGSTDGDLTVLLSTGGTATAGDDFATISTVVVIPDGQSSIDLTLTPTDDAIDESNETVTLTLASDADYQVGTAASATVTIADNDAASEPPPDDGGDDQLPPPPGGDDGQQPPAPGDGDQQLPPRPRRRPRPPRREGPSAPIAAGMPGQPGADTQGPSAPAAGEQTPGPAGPGMAGSMDAGVPASIGALDSALSARLDPSGSGPSLGSGMIAGGEGGAITGSSSQNQPNSSSPANPPEQGADVPPAAPAQDGPDGQEPTQAPAQPATTPSSPQAPNNSTAPSSMNSTTPTRQATRGGRSSRMPRRSRR